MNRDFKILLLFPPVWEDELPPLGLPTLTAYLHNAGFTVSQRDLNIEFWAHFYEEKKIAEIFYKACQNNESEISGTNIKEYSLNQFIEAVKTGQFPRRDYRDICMLFGGFSYNDSFKKELPCHPWESFLMYHDRFFKNMSFSPCALSSRELHEISTTHNKDLNPYIRYCEENVLPDIRNFRPSLIGISIIAANQVVPAFTLASLIKRYLDNVHVVIGGPWCSQLYDVLLTKPIIFDMVDSVIVFEGEKALEQLATRLRDGIAVGNISNLIYEDNGVLHFPGIRNNQDMNLLPSPTFDGFPLNYYELPGILPLQTSRGCYWKKCTFCSYWTLEPQYKTRSVDLVMDDIKKVSGQYGADKILFVDASISTNRLRELSKKLLNTGINIKWECFARFEDSLSEYIIRLMAKAGCRVIVWGLESGCSETL